MIIKAIGFIENPNNNLYQEQQKENQTKYYQPKQNKEVIKKDFQEMVKKGLTNEIHFEKII